MRTIVTITTFWENTALAKNHILILMTLIPMKWFSASCVKIGTTTRFLFYKNKYFIIHIIIFIFAQHLGSSPPPDQDYSEMICGQCMEKYPFLNAYVLPVESDQLSLACKLEAKTIEKEQLNLKKATFWPEGWRNRLCRCEKCLVSNRMINYELFFFYFILFFL